MRGRRSCKVVDGDVDGEDSVAPSVLSFREAAWASMETAQGEEEVEDEEEAEEDEEEEEDDFGSDDYLFDKYEEDTY